MKKIRLLFIPIILVSLFYPSIGKAGESLLCHRETGQCFLLTENPRYNIEYIGERKHVDYEMVYLSEDPLIVYEKYTEEELHEEQCVEVIINKSIITGSFIPMDEKTRKAAKAPNTFLWFFKQSEKYSNGMTKATYTGYGWSKDDIKYPHGEHTEWYENGTKKIEVNYIAGLLYGKAMAWYENGIKREESNFECGKRNGISKIYYKNGGLRFKDTYKYGEKTNRKAYDELGKLLFNQDY